MSKRGDDVQPLNFITHCPECDTELIRKEGEAQHYCPNESGCPPQIKGKMEHFISRKAMDIDGLGEETIEQLFDEGLINNIADIYGLSMDQLLPLERMAEKSASNLLAALDGRISHYWTMESLAEWSADDERLEKGRVQLRYRQDSQRRLNFVVNYRRGLLKQASLGGLWPLSSRWAMMADISYALNDQQTRDATVGLAYQDCCWGIRMAARRYINDDDGSINTALALQFELRGLTSVGSKISGFDKQ